MVLRVGSEGVQRPSPAVDEDGADVGRAGGDDLAAACSGRVLGVTVSGSELDEDSNAKVEARLYGRTATVRVEMTARYPDPIRGIAAEVRRTVIERLRVLAGVEASLVDVEVVGLSKAAARRRRVT